MADEKRIPGCCHHAPAAALLRGIEQFNCREYFECHETLEELWNVERGPGRHRNDPAVTAEAPGAGCADLYKGILQIGVGCYHLLRHNYHGATVKLQSGADYLERFAPVCKNVEVERLIGDARSLRAALVALGPHRFQEVDLALLPRVYLVADAT
jgi:predicted metal-dependent hydrolase